MLCTAEGFGKLPMPGENGQTTARTPFLPCDSRAVRLHFAVFGETCTKLPGGQVEFLRQGQS